MSGTRAFLVRRLAALLVVTALAVSTLLAAYYGVSRNSAAVTDRSTPAILQVAAATEALRGSYREAEGSLNGSTTDVEGLGENYRTRLSTAGQSLAQAVKSTTGGEPARRSLLTVAGLVSSYSDIIEQAYVNRDNANLRAAYLSYARTMLERSDGDILGRLRAVQARQLHVLEEQTSFGWLLSCAWLLVPVLFLTLAGLLGHTQYFLRHHFRRLVNPWLATATALLVAVVPLAVFTFQTQGRLESARTTLSEADIGSDSGGTAKEVADTMRDTHWRAGAVGWIPLGGTALAALIVAGLQPRIDEYRFQPR
ncbi:hypothetical protein ACH4VS_07720 [Streptomyces hygroscopicus]|uniref:hypothetical protein n=1 Tax=Streptomyces hygroscopicus TaxID=1912 RepID=UPI000836D6D5|nr:hypothetical protein [Streptomyces hygroscopicus]GLV72328.1 hypothetical protein Shyhy02_03310 [Streptomyces hygroscopicus subsp. hygroscopicus]